MRILTICALAAIATGGALAQSPSMPRLVSYAEVQPVFDAVRDQRPKLFAAGTAQDIERAWPSWAAQHDADIRARVARGDEDSLVNFWLYGTSFTKQPRALARDIAEHGETTIASVLAGRASDLARAIIQPGANERVRVARTVIERAGIDPAAPDATARITRYLNDVRDRVLREYHGYDRVVQPATRSNDPSEEIAAFATIFKNRGLSSDTSLLPDFAVDRALVQMGTSGEVAPGSVRRVAVVGPGLDFTNKADGYDFYPPQTIQPFAVIDSLIRLGLARAGQLAVTTFDVNSRVNDHITHARERAATGLPYVITLPLNRSESWTTDVKRYWSGFGRSIGVPDSAAALNEADVTVRTIHVRPDVVASLAPLDLDIVLQRLAPLPDDARFDLVIATNVFVYYDLFEQSLAVANVGAMLKPGGLLVTNTAVLPISPLEPSAHYLSISYSSRQHDYVVWYRRHST